MSGSESTAGVREERSDDGRVVTIILRRLAERNAVDGPTAHALHEAFRRFDANDEARVAVLHGEGGAFCAGADLKAVARGLGDHGDEQGSSNPMVEPEITPDFDPAVPQPHNAADSSLGPMGPTRLLASKPVIASIAGPAVAGGLELACWCDLRVVEAGSVLGVFCRRWGVPLIDGGTFRLPRLVGQSHALDLILTGRGIGAEEALRIGLANRVAYPPAEGGGNSGVDVGRRYACDRHEQAECVPGDQEGQRLVGTARQVAEALAARLAAFPQGAMLADRASTYGAFDPPLPVAVASEFARAGGTLSEAVQGAGIFAKGKGRGGSFDKPLVHNRAFSSSVASVGSRDKLATPTIFRQGQGPAAVHASTCCRMSTTSKVGLGGKIAAATVAVAFSVAAASISRL